MVASSWVRRLSVLGERAAASGRVTTRRPIGTIENSGSFMTQTSAGFGRHAEKGFFSLSYGLQDGRYGVPPFAAETECEEGEEHHDHEHVKIDWRRHNARFHGGWRELSGSVEAFRATVNYSDWRHNELEDTRSGRDSNKQFTIAASSISSEPAGCQAASACGDCSATSRLSATKLWRRRWIRRVRALRAGGDRVRKHPASVRRTDGAQQLRSRRTAHRSFTGVSGSAGFYVPTWNNGAVVLNYTTSYRAPALEELYNLGPHLGNLTFEIGNPDLQRERGNGMEFSVRHSSSRVRAEVTGFTTAFAISCISRRPARSRTG